MNESCCYFKKKNYNKIGGFKKLPNYILLNSSFHLYFIKDLFSKYITDMNWIQNLYFKKNDELQTFEKKVIFQQDKLSTIVVLRVFS